MRKNINFLIKSYLIANLTACSFLVPNQNTQPNPITEPKRNEVTNPAPKPTESEDSLYTTYSVEKTKSSETKKEEMSAQAMPAKDIHSFTSNKVWRSAAKLAMPMGGASGASIRAHEVSAPQASDMMGNVYYQSPNTEAYDAINENTFQQSINKPLSTFSIDVDTASYSNMRRMISQGSLPPADAVRIEELVNYFDYDYATPESGAFAVNMEMAPALWNQKHKLVRIGIKGKEIKVDKRPASNLVFLIDVSGSMNTPEKLPLVKSALGLLVDKLSENDKISIVVYAGAAGLVLPPTSGENKHKILKAIDQLSAGGSTNGGQGIELAYKTAAENFIKGGVNRVILASDGDFNVGTTSREALVNLVETNGKKNIYLTILGFGMGNYKDGLMETLSNKGNGNYAYIDNGLEARKVMVEQMSGTLVTIAKDVKIQVEFNPKFVKSYRLIGYENRLLKNEDFNNDAKDAGDIGAGHTVTALYEVIPAGTIDDSEDSTSVDNLKYQNTQEKEFKKPTVSIVHNSSNEVLNLKIRYKKPDGDVSTKQEFPLVNKETTLANSSESFRFASAVALFGMLLRQSEFAKGSNYQDVINAAKNAVGADKNSYRQDFIDLVKKAKNMGVQAQRYIEE